MAKAGSSKFGTITTKRNSADTAPDSPKKAALSGRPSDFYRNLSAGDFVA
jgi:hypothetical protein